MGVNLGVAVRSPRPLEGLQLLFYAATLPFSIPKENHVGCEFTGRVHNITVSRSWNIIG